MRECEWCECPWDLFNFNRKSLSRLLPSKTLSSFEVDTANDDGDEKYHSSERYAYYKTLSMTIGDGNQSGFGDWRCECGESIRTTEVVGGCVGTPDGDAMTEGREVFVLPVLGMDAIADEELCER
jgi:hypothetical protein